MRSLALANRKSTRLVCSIVEWGPETMPGWRGLMLDIYGECAGCLTLSCLKKF